jgi:hypothetical protein
MPNLNNKCINCLEFVEIVMIGGLPKVFHYPSVLSARGTTCQDAWHHEVSEYAGIYVRVKKKGT